ncbi:HAMP domain-containing histidine kinase [Alteromonas ponticola]|uniref:histidine kinase n=1 Tax=Alteromonas aquimaris TaxID=2998417 RepID=A0ABT3P8B5_9ALTE|nr:HAMP domain-containing sensor histidine kinase [Alteromonas aquimaris]MCW8109016.1 HAMP domain-containing histidine kinase [Alteromonas aquimaris]
MKADPDLAKFNSISRQVIIRFCLFTLILCAVYSLLSLIMLYNLEDRFIEREMAHEMNYLSQEYRNTGNWSAPRREHMKLYFARQDFPQDIREMAIREPQRKEFSGDQGRHYHIMKLPAFSEAWLVAEVSGELLVRPIRDDVIKFLVISGFVVTLIACLIAWLIGRRTTQPLRKLAHLINTMQPGQMQQGFSTQFPNNEIRFLARSLENTMLAFNEALKRETCFTRDVSHELRTPLAVIRNALEVYRQELSTLPAELKRIDDASQNMERIVTTLLMLARAEHVESEKAAVKLMPIIEQTILNHHHLLADKPVKVNVEDSCHVSVWAQPGMLDVLLANILSNAFQYTLSGQVTIRFHQNMLVIEDTGPGIDTEIASEITCPAVRGKHSLGYGFGLAIVERLCQQQAWELKVKSEQGTEIQIKINA